MVSEGDQSGQGQGLLIVHAGLFRTATTSMAEAYKILGYKTHHALDDPFGSPWAGVEEAAEATWPDVPKATPRPPFTRADWDKLWGDNWDVSMDLASPFALQLIEAYPDAKVVVVQRDFETWWPSFESEILKPLFPPFATIQLFIARHILGYRAAHAMHKVLFGLFQAKDKKEVEAHAQDTYEGYYRDVRKMVPAEKRLEYKMGSGWEPLCAFLGKDVPDVPFPHVNDRKSHEANRTGRRKKVTKKIIRAIFWYGTGAALVVGAWRYLRPNSA